MRRIALLSLGIIFLSLYSCTESKLNKRAAEIHAAALTVDSHVDTPMSLTRGDFDFGKKQEDNRRSKLDLPRMKEGGLDGVFFAVFVGQKERTPENTAGATREARNTLDSIYAMVEKYKEELGIVTSPSEFKEVEASGKQAIFIGMENGFPIGNDISMLDTFYNRGVRYITLCHSYNNDICDSSTDSIAEYNGLSEFGEEVVARMNDLGMMIDLSHASDATASQVLDMSRTPVIASHSCAKALCDHPRNLSDDLLIKLKENGGVIQMCILSAYVKTPAPNPDRDSARAAVVEKHGEYYTLDDDGKAAFIKDWYQVDIDFPMELATVKDVVDHIDHIVEVAGIDHVGIGTDFDGGGGVSDCFDVSQLPNITRELVRRGYSESDIQKIWSGNLMRVMAEVEKAAV